MKTGIFGGTFDPPHLGHVILAVEAASQLALDRVLWVLTPDPPHKLKKHKYPTNQRLELVKAVVALEDKFLFSDIELNRPGPHFALDTVKLLSKQFPEDQLIYLMGGDSLTNLHTWHKPKDLVELCDGLGVMRRPGDQVDLSTIEQQLPGIQDKLSFIDVPLLEISSTDIRNRIHLGLPYKYFLPEQVFQLIDQNRYYISSEV